MITKEEIKRRLWDGANELRGSMDASRYKDYMLGLMFYKFLSDKTLEAFRTISVMKQATEQEVISAYKNAKEEYGESIEKNLQQLLGYFVAPEYLYQTWINDINSGNFEVQKVTDSLNNFERTIAVSGDTDDFKGLFSSSTLDLTDTALGSNLNERSKNIKALILLFADLDMVALQKGDVLGDAYEYLIGQFAMESGKKAGEFYTPRQVSEVMAQIAAKNSNIKSIYDPTVGSGSLLLTVGKHLGKDVQKELSYYGQEKNTATYNLTRMNLLLHGVRPEKMTIKNGDTLSYDWPEDPEHPNEGVQFDAVVMNPPYSVKNWNKAGLKVSDPRFEMAGILPPDSKGDFAFLMHGLYHLSTNGTMAIVLPHGVLFRGSSEGDIRKRLLEKNRIDAIIGLPNNLFTNTGIPVVVIILKKNREIGEPVLIIDSSNNFVKEGKQNVLREKDIAKIVDTYVERREEDGYSHLATRDEIIQNDYNLNIPRYVEAINEEIPQDVDAHLYGGIPKSNIDRMKVLNAMVPDILHRALKDVRPNYVEMIESTEELSKEVFSDKRIVDKKEAISKDISEYIDKWWRSLKTVNEESNLEDLKEDMLVEIKALLSKYEFIDVYNGYQIVAEIWKNALTHDVEIIAGSDFYTMGRTREPNMVSKGSGKNKREEQDGWKGSIVPNNLIMNNLYQTELKEIENKNARMQEIETEIADLVEAAKAEDSAEANALGGILNEAGDAFENKKIKGELKSVSKGSLEYELLNKVEKLFSEKTTLIKEVKDLEKDLRDAVEEKITVLTDEEIDNLMYKKWFTGVVEAMVQLVEEPLKKELDILHMLKERYSETLSMIDDEIAELEKVLKNAERIGGDVMKNEKLVPKRRFKEFQNAPAWEQRKFKDCFDYLQNNSLSRADLTDEIGAVLNVHYGDILVRFGEVIDMTIEKLPSIVNESILSKFQTSILKDGDVIIADAAEDETVGKCSEIKGLGNRKVLSGLHTIPVRPKEKYAAGYLGYYMNARSYHDQLLPLMQGTKVSSISKSAIQDTTIMFPKSVEEQEQIGAYFQSLDYLITLHQRKLEKIKNIKSAFLSEMFPADGETKPKRRFKGFTDDWEQRKLGGLVLDHNAGIYISKEDYGSGTNVIGVGNIYDNDIFDGEIYRLGPVNDDRFLLEENDLIYGESSLVPEGIARTVCVGRNGVGSAFAWHTRRVKLDQNFVNSHFAALELNYNIAIRKYLMSVSTQTALTGMTTEGYFGATLVLPSVKEQAVISEFFKNLDHLITLHQCKLEKLQNMKKAYLEEMFV